MAARRKPPVKKVKFELTYSGIAGIGIVCFCIFLWMFLLGVWTGQTLLLPSIETSVKVAGNTPLPAATEVDDLLHIEPVREKKVVKE
ncbi:hypothetical protein [Desulfopila aestuarii]|uniref:Uncharacterized protein n=1 Tax=Desulfopila aestuarii DSM 18488 TaxID=1121416 RepID=A0A1M7YD89_9BACT|nr:hypothetical protein [Desulfopila aestuarii]SHO50549.1 hypothetical protein SAMN02745220_03522 [Desulfopila aestuarii DSM 18488]